MMKINILREIWFHTTGIHFLNEDWKRLKVLWKRLMIDDFLALIKDL